jgi:hypothetical protein
MLNTLISAPSNEHILARLQEVLYKEPASAEKQQEYIAAAASDLTAHLPSLEYLTRLRNDYNKVREAIRLLWGELDFARRMGFREMIMHIDRTNRLYALLTDEDREALLRAMDSSAQERFALQQHVYSLMVKDILPLIKADAEVSSSITAEEVWNTVKRLDPKMEDALLKPLDSTKYVKRDLGKTPRRSA